MDLILVLVSFLIDSLRFSTYRHGCIVCEHSFTFLSKLFACREINISGFTAVSRTSSFSVSNVERGHNLSYY